MAEFRLTIVAPKKTGATLTSNLLDRHPSIACFWESNWPLFESQHNILHPGPNRDRNGVTRARTPEGQYDPAYRACFLEAIDEFAEKTGASLICDKWWNIGHLPLLFHHFPEHRLLNVARHPYGIWLSGETFRDRRIGDLIVAEAMAHERLWRWWEKALPRDQHMTIRYEKLCAAPYTTLGAVYVKLLGLTDRDVVIERAEPDPLPERWYWIENAVERPDAELATRYVRELRRKQKDHIAGLPGVRDYAKRYGYQL